jgi:hypothetical protein
MGPASFCLDGAALSRTGFCRTGSAGRVLPDGFCRTGFLHKVLGFCMPQCYLLALTVGSSLDQQSNNISLFSMVEQINVPPGAPPPPGGKIPLEVHAYFRLLPGELGQNLEFRFVLEAKTGLETFGDVVTHRVTAPRFRTRTLGLAVPPVLGHYELRVDFRLSGQSEWHRDPLSWPIAFVEVSSKPQVTH